MLDVWKTLLSDCKPISEETKDELVRDLNESTELSDSFAEAFKDIEDELNLCDDCNGVVNEIAAVDEGLSVCSECRNTEQGSYSVSYYSDFGIYFNHSSEKWVKHSSDDLF